jgi:PAS domain S-box-containing protein
VRENDSFSLFSSVKTVRELLQRKLSDGAGSARGELEASLQEIEALWEELRSQSQELASERQRYSEFFEYAPDAYLITDGHGAIREANRAAAELLQIAARELQGKPLALFVPEAERQIFRSQLIRAGSQPDGELHTWNGSLSSRSGQVAAVHFRVRAMPVPHAGLAGLCWLVQRKD